MTGSATGRNYFPLPATLGVMKGKALPAPKQVDTGCHPVAL